MKIALLLSGRIYRYRECLLPLLQNLKDDIEMDIFISVNDQSGEYYDQVSLDLKPWLRCIRISKYEKPKDFRNTYTELGFAMQNLSHMTRNIVYNILSLFYNDNVAFNMACEYADKNNFEYDCYMRFRADIHVPLKEFPKITISKDKLFCLRLSYKLCVTDACENGLFIDGKYHWFGCSKLNGLPSTGDIAYGSRSAMSIYCNTYDYSLQKDKESNECFIGEYILTSNIYFNCKSFEFFDYEYYYDPYRSSKK
jgi:hypothetical protein